MQFGQRRLLERTGFDAQPSLEKISHVILQLGITGFLGIRSQDKATALELLLPCIRIPKLLHARTQRFALLGRDFLRDANVIVLRQKHQLTPRQTDLARQARTFAANRVFDHLHHQGLAFKHLFFDWRRRLRRAGRARRAIGKARMHRTG